MKFVRKVIEDLMLVTGIGLMLAALISYHPQDAIKPAHAQPTLLGPNATSVALTASSVPIIGINPSRHALQFCNPSASIETIAPAPLTPTTNSIGITLPAVASGVTSCFSPPVNAPSIGQAWNGISAGSTNVTVMEYP